VIQMWGDLARLHDHPLRDWHICGNVKPLAPSIAPICQRPTVLFLERAIIDDLHQPFPTADAEELLALFLADVMRPHGVRDIEVFRIALATDAAPILALPWRS